MLELHTITQTFNGKAVSDLQYIKSYKYNAKGTLLIQGNIKGINGKPSSIEWNADGSSLPGRDKTDRLLVSTLENKKLKNSTSQLSLF